jgi:DUF4097 and DUF4098 domain-containing protein YvlB
MKKLIILGLIAPLCLGLAQALDDEHRGSHASITMNSDSPNENCTDQLRVNEAEFRANMRDEETKTIPNQPLTIKGEDNGGIAVSTWDSPEFSLKLCKQVAAADEATARKVLAETHLEINGSQISVQVPKEDDFVLGTLIVVKAPRNATLDLHVQNGGVSLNNFTGTAEAHAQNGGISLRHSSGKLTAKAENGGVSIKDCGGEVTAEVENGGLSIALPEHWDGKGLEAHAQNGGLVISVPKTFNGGLEVAALRETSLICRDDICSAGERSVEGGHKIFRMGGANPQVKASTENGGIIIQERDHHRGEL